MQLPMISVAMITYNHRPYIAQAIDSVLQQNTGFPVELLIGEDCSTDGTRDLVFDYQKKHPERIRVITSERNVGVHQNLLRVERACTGKYVAYCEGDDFWQDPLKLAKQVEFLEARPDYSMVHCHCHRYVVASKRFEHDAYTVPRDLDDGDGYNDLLLHRRSVMTLTIVLRRELLHRILDNNPECSDERFLMGDTQRCLEVARLGKVGCIHEPLATTNLLPESASQSRDPNKALRFVMSGRALLLHYLSKYSVSPEIERSVRVRAARAVLWRAYQAQAYDVASSMYDECKRSLERLPADVSLWHFGSKSGLHRTIADPLLTTYRLFGKVARRVRKVVTHADVELAPTNL